jgi:hypothetical protein
MLTSGKSDLTLGMSNRFALSLKEHDHDSPGHEPTEFSVRRRTTERGETPTLPQILHLMNGSTMTKRLRAADRSLA